MKDSTENKIQTNVVVFIKWFLILALIFAAIGGGVFLYQNIIYPHIGLREYRADLAYLNTLSGEEKTQLTEHFFGQRQTRNLFGGVLAGTWKYGIWVWGKPGLTYFPIDQNTKFIVITGCTAANLGDLDFSSNHFVGSVLANINSWAKGTHPGNYVTVFILGGNKIKSVLSFPDFSPSVTPWMFCDQL